ncbi:MAG: ABC transporter ATP-binding protein, partial [Spirochaetota bacterium]
SGGELQKVMLARALVQEPKVLFLDEPTNNLDLKNQLEVMNIVRNIAHQKSITIIAVMHDLNLALRYAEKFIIMKEGTVLEAGSTRCISPGLVKEVYGIDALVEWVGGMPVVIPVEGSRHS